MNARDFAKRYSADPDWIKMMDGQDVPYLTPGQRGKLFDCPAEVIRHVRNGIYLFYTPVGDTNAYGGEFRKGWWG